MNDAAEIEPSLTAPGAPYETAPVLPPEPKEYPFTPKPPVNELPRNELPLFPVAQRIDTPTSVSKEPVPAPEPAAWDVQPRRAPNPTVPSIEVAEITHPGTLRLVNQFNESSTQR